MGYRELRLRTLQRKAAGADQSYPEHAGKAGGGAAATPPAAAGNPELRVRLAVLKEACPDRGAKLPGQPCGSKLYRCDRYGDVTSAAGPCAEAQRQCTLCPEHPARKRLAAELAAAAVAPAPALAPPAPRSYAPVHTRHLLYHVYPRRGSRWRERVLRLRERIELFNGSRVVAVAGDGTTDDAALVADALAGCRCEVIAVPNDPNLREVATFLPLFERVAHLGEGHATLYAHAKGVTRPPGATCHRWAEVLEEVLLGDFPAVEESLARRPLAGIFKKLGAGWPSKESRSRWHYSGSWFWFRNAALFAKADWRRIDRFWSGIEPYPSLHFAAAEAGCVFHQGPVPKLDLYSADYWAQVVEPAYAKYRAARPQSQATPHWFPGDVAGWLSVAEGQELRELARGKRVLEIGSFAGRSTVCLATEAQSVVCVDPFDGRATPEPRDTSAEFRANLERRGVAHKVAALRATTAEAGPRLSPRQFDVVFVDGDHDEAAVREDISHAKRLLAPGGVVAFHDYRRESNPGVTAAVDAAGLVVERVVDTLAVCRVPPAAPTLSVIVPTNGRERLSRALASVTPQLLPGDEVLVLRDASGDWGHTPRNAAMPRCAGTHIMSLDDDDELTPGALAQVRAAVAENPDRPHVFRMRRGPQADTLPLSREVAVGNVSTQMLVVPNDPARLGAWGSRYEGDFDFLTSTLALYPADALVWRDEVVAVWRPEGGAP